MAHMIQTSPSSTVEGGEEGTVSGTLFYNRGFCYRLDSLQDSKIYSQIPRNIGIDFGGELEGEK